MLFQLFIAASICILAAMMITAVSETRRAIEESRTLIQTTGLACFFIFMQLFFAYSIYKLSGYLIW